MSENYLNINETVLLLGAGASADAGIKTSAEMLEHLERRIRKETNWKKFTDLYYLVKGFSEGASTAFRRQSGAFHVEALVEILHGIETIKESPLYPFWAGWTPPLSEICRETPKLAGELSIQIFEEVRKLLTPKNESSCSYFEKLGSLAKNSGFPLRVFTLNYDLCLEKACKSYTLQRGFGAEIGGVVTEQEDRIWDWNNFEDDSTDNVDIALYKLHGSLDWTRNTEGTIEAVDSHEQISFQDAVMIFGGGANKLKSVDPYLFNVYEFRRWTMQQMRRLVCIGYSFSDIYINELIQQAFQSDSTRELVVVGQQAKLNEKEIKERVEWLRNQIDLPEEANIRYLPDGSKGFLNSVSQSKLSASSSTIPF